MVVVGGLVRLGGEHGSGQPNVWQGASGDAFVEGVCGVVTKARIQSGRPWERNG